MSWTLPHDIILFHTMIHPLLLVFPIFQIPGSVPKLQESSEQGSLRIGTRHSYHTCTVVSPRTGESVAEDRSTGVADMEKIGLGQGGVPDARVSSRASLARRLLFETFRLHLAVSQPWVPHGRSGDRGESNCGARVFNENPGAPGEMTISGERQGSQPKRPGVLSL